MSIFASVAERRAAITHLRDYRVSRFILPVQNWKAFVAPASINWEHVKFSGALVDTVPDDKRGVYCFVAEPRIARHPACSYLMYIGKTDRSFRVRYREYLREMTEPKGRPFVQDMLITWEDYLYFYYAEIDLVQIRPMEDALLRAYMPPMNETIGAEIDQVRKAVLG